MHQRITIACRQVSAVAAHFVTKSTSRCWFGSSRGKVMYARLCQSTTAQQSNHARLRRTRQCSKQGDKEPSYAPRETYAPLILRENEHVVGIRRVGKKRVEARRIECVRLERERLCTSAANRAVRSCERRVQCGVKSRTSQIRQWALNLLH